MRLKGAFRSLAWFFACLACTLGAVDAGSVILTNITVPDDVRRAGLVAATSVDGQPVTRQMARLAFDAAHAEGRQHGIAVSAKDFTIYPDGRVTLTADQTAPTLLFKRIEALRHFADVRATVTVEKLPYS